MYAQCPYCVVVLYMQKCPYYVVLYMQKCPYCVVLYMQKCPYYVVLYMLSGGMTTLGVAQLPTLGLRRRRRQLAHLRARTLFCAADRHPQRRLLRQNLALRSCGRRLRPLPPGRLSR